MNPNQKRERAEKLALSSKWKSNRAGLAEHIYNTDESLSLFLIQIGIERCVSKSRSRTRRVLRRTVVKPQPSVQRPGGVKYSVQLSPRSKKRLMEATVGLFQQWMVGDTMLGEATKDLLLTAAANERKSGSGHVKNAIWYEKLASQMNEKQTVSQRWESADAVELIREELWKDADKKELVFLEAAE